MKYRYSGDMLETEQAGHDGPAMVTLGLNWTFESDEDADNFSVAVRARLPAFLRAIYRTVDRSEQS